MLIRSVLKVTQEPWARRGRGRWGTHCRCRHNMPFMLPVRSLCWY